MEVEIYSGIEFTRFHQGLIFFLTRSPLKNTWCKLSLASRESKRKERKKGIGQREEQKREKEISGIAVRSEECLRSLPWTLCCTQPFKTTATSPQAAIYSGSPTAPLQSYTDPLTFCTCVAVWLTANPIYPPSLNACWSNARQLACLCSRFDHEKGIFWCVTNAHILFLRTKSSRIYVQENLFLHLKTKKQAVLLKLSSRFRYWSCSLTNKITLMLTV